MSVTTCCEPRMGHCDPQCSFTLVEGAGSSRRPVSFIHPLLKAMEGDWHL